MKCQLQSSCLLFASNKRLSAWMIILIFKTSLFVKVYLIDILLKLEKSVTALLDFRSKELLITSRSKMIAHLNEVKGYMKELSTEFNPTSAKELDAHNRTAATSCLNELISGSNTGASE